MNWLTRFDGPQKIDEGSKLYEAIKRAIWHKRFELWIADMQELIDARNLNMVVLMQGPFPMKASYNHIIVCPIENNSIVTDKARFIAAIDLLDLSIYRRDASGNIIETSLGRLDDEEKGKSSIPFLIDCLTSDLFWEKNKKDEIDSIIKEPTIKERVSLILHKVVKSYSRFKET